MKKKVMLLVVILSGILVYWTDSAKAVNGAGPDVISLKTGVAPLPFQHWKHQALNGGECSNCHKVESGGKIEGWGKETAHGLCIPCHDLNDKGPVECGQCHKK